MTSTLPSYYEHNIKQLLELQEGYDDEDYLHGV